MVILSDNWTIAVATPEHLLKTCIQSIKKTYELHFDMHAAESDFRISPMPATGPSCKATFHHLSLDNFSSLLTHTHAPSLALSESIIQKAIAVTL
jgi:hypothetical protein